MRRVYGAFGMAVTAFDVTPEMVAESRKRFAGVPGLLVIQGDVTHFRFDIPPVDFAYVSDFGHLPDMESVCRALRCIRAHMRTGGGLAIEAGLINRKDSYSPPREFWPLAQVYEGKTVWKTGDGRNGAIYDYTDFLY